MAEIVCKSTTQTRNT